MTTRTTTPRSVELPPIPRGSIDPESEWVIAVSLHRRARGGALGPAIPITQAWQDNDLTRDPSVVGVIRARIQSIGRDHKIKQMFEPTLVLEGKNIGRANETNVFCQALREAHSTYARYLRRKSAHVSTGPRSIPMPTPMLARVFDEEDVRAAFATAKGQVFVQRKYDGLRAIATQQSSGDVLVYGRRGIVFNGISPRICDLIARICSAFRAQYPTDGTLYLDGELYKHGMPLQTISGIARRTTADSSADELQFIVFDAFIVADGAIEADTRIFSRRFEILQHLFESQPADTSAVVLAETFRVASLDDIRALYARFLREKYEGAMIRADTAYEHSPNERHSHNLLKMKPLFDAEFKIVGFTTAEKGRARGALLFVCATAAGERFTVSPMGSLEERKRLARAFARDNARVFKRDWLGHLLVVQYEALSIQGVPLRARTTGMLRDGI